MKKLPIGVSDFEEIVKGGYYYVDKTMLIKNRASRKGKAHNLPRGALKRPSI